MIARPKLHWLLSWSDLWNTLPFKKNDNKVGVTKGWEYSLQASKGNSSIWVKLVHAKILPFINSFCFVVWCIDLFGAKCIWVENVFNGKQNDDLFEIQMLMGQ